MSAFDLSPSCLNRIARRMLPAAIALLGLGLGASLQAAAATYSINSPNYTGVTNFTAPCAAGSCANFTTGMKTSGTIVTTAPLAANLAFGDIRPLVASFSVSDGLTSYSSADAQVRGYTISAATDAAGAITALELRVLRWHTAGAHAAGDRLDVLFITPTPAHIAYHNAVCATVGVQNGLADSCTGFTTNTNSSEASQTAAVVPTLTASAAAGVPTLGEWAMLSLAAVLALTGMAKARSGTRRISSV